MIDDDKIETPATLIEAYKRWNDAGRPSQVNFRWSMKSWLRQLETSEALLRQFPETVGRSNGVDLVGKVEDEDDAIRAFLLAMIWGYGPIGYGPYRTRRVLDSVDAGPRLLEVAKLAQSDGGLAAFSHIAAKRREDSGYLKFLGPAFGTKYLFFLTSAVDNVETTPVMDAVVSRWFRKNTGDTRLKLGGWHEPSYATYLAHLKTWSRSLSENGEPLQAEDVEYLIFAAGSDFERTEEWDGDTSQMVVSDLLDNLRDVASTQLWNSDNALRLIGELEEALEPSLDSELPQEETRD